MDDFKKWSISQPIIKVPGASLPPAGNRHGGHRKERGQGLRHHGH